MRSESEALRLAALETSRVVLQRQLQAEHERKQALSLLGAVLDASPDGIAALSLERRYISMNQRYAQMWGWTEDTAQAMGPQEIYAFCAPQLADPTTLHRMFEQIETPNVEVVEFRDGRIYERFRSPQMVDRRQVGVVVQYRDITERKLAERLQAGGKSALELVSVGKPLAQILETIVLDMEVLSPGTLCSISLLDTDGVHLRHGAAPSFPEAYNRVVDGVAIGPSVGSCGTAAYRNEQVIVTDIATDPLWADYAVLALPLGLRACWSMPVRSGAGKVLGTFALYYREPRSPAQADLDLIQRWTHLTGIAIERKHAEDEILALNASLEARVQERTRELNAANMELEAFSYSVSHDLRSPLNTIDGFSQMLFKTNQQHLDDKGRHYLSRIRAGAQQMGALIEGLLSLAKMSREPLRLQEVDLSVLSHRVVQECQEREPEREVRITIAENLRVFGDTTLLLVAMQNLLGNAWKYTARQSHPSIEVSCETAPGGESVYVVRDNGAGFDMLYADKLFDVFQRLHSPSEFSGTGIGLANVKRVIERHGGRIWAESRPNEGATFYFTLGCEL